MKQLPILLLAAFFLLFSLSTKAQSSKEIVIIGTMHTVPKIIRNSYRPMLEKAKAYAPEAVYVETAMPEDSLSWEYLKEGYSSTLRRVYVISDSLRNEPDFHYDEALLNQLLAKDKLDLTDEDLKKMRSFFLYQRDFPNFYYHKYIQDHGKSEKIKPSRGENLDLSSPLALYFGHKKIYATDDQQTNGMYMKYWPECEEVSKENGEIKKLRKTTFKVVSGTILPALFGRLGNHANKLKSAERLHEMSSFDFADSSSQECYLAARYWDERNHRIAKNLGTQITNQSFQKSVLVIGGAHIIGVKEELEKQFPDIKVILFNDL